MALAKPQLLSEPVLPSVKWERGWMLWPPICFQHPLSVSQKFTLGRTRGLARLARGALPCDLTPGEAGMEVLCPWALVTFKILPP